MENARLENGNLICTYRDFVDCGVSMGAIKVALSQLVALGFIEVEVQGRRSAGGAIIPSRYRLTYLLVHGEDAKPTNEWARKDDQAVADAMAQLGTARSQKTLQTRTLTRYGALRARLLTSRWPRLNEPVVQADPPKI